MPPTNQGSPPTPRSKTMTETVVASTFPELVNMSDSSFLDHWNSTDYSIDDDLDGAYSDQYFVDDDDDDEEESNLGLNLNISSTPSHLDSSIYTSSAGEDEFGQSNDTSSLSLFRSPPKNADRNRSGFLISPSPTATNTPITAQSEWWTPGVQLQQESRRSSNDDGNDNRLVKNGVSLKQSESPLKLVWWEKIIIAVALLGVASCVCISVAIVVIQTTDIGGLVSSAFSAKDATMTPAPSLPVQSVSPYINSDRKHERLYGLRKWLGMEQVAPGTTQYDALFWLAHVDLPHILGRIPSQQEYDEFRSKLHESRDREIENDDAFAEIEAFRERLNQRYALLVLYYALLESGGGVAEGGWASVTGARIHECLWPGVLCFRNDEQVSGLELDPNVGLIEGTLPSEIGLLSHLERLEITYSNLTGDLPPALYELSDLTTLRLINNELSATITPSIGNLTKLISLELTNGGFRGSLPTELGLLSNLKLLFLSQNDRLTGTIPTELARLEQLERISLHSTGLTGSLPEELCVLRNSSRLNYLTANCESTLGSTTEVHGATAEFIDCDCCTLCF